MTTEEFDITDGKKLLYLVFGASRWEFERIEIGTMEIPPVAEGCLDRIRGTLLYLLKNWKNIHADDRAMGMEGITRDIRAVKESGFFIRGVKSYNAVARPGDANAGSYVAYLKILQDE